MLQCFCGRKPEFSAGSKISRTVSEGSQIMRTVSEGSEIRRTSLYPVNMSPATLEN